MQTEEGAWVEGRDVVFFDHVSGGPVDAVAEGLLLLVRMRAVGGDRVEEGEEGEDGAGEGEVGGSRHCFFESHLVVNGEEVLGNG